MLTRESNVQVLIVLFLQHWWFEIFHIRQTSKQLGKVQLELFVPAGDALQWPLWGAVSAGKKPPGEPASEARMGTLIDRQRVKTVAGAEKGDIRASRRHDWYLLSA